MIYLIITIKFFFYDKSINVKKIKLKRKQFNVIR
jgi:hypothetical protein